MASGEFVPLVSLEHPEALENLHKDFQHAGSDIPVQPVSATKNESSRAISHSQRARGKG